MSTRDFISGEAELGSESDDNDFDEETGDPVDRPRKQRQNFDDSSEEEEDDDEEEEQKVGFALSYITRLTLLDP